MQITFDPLNDAEASAVIRFLKSRETRVESAISAQALAQFYKTSDAPAPSAAPLEDDAPSTADAGTSENVPVDPSVFSQSTPSASTSQAAAPATAPAPAPIPAPEMSLAANAQQRDSTGLPYDARIHSSPPSIKADGTWRKKRNVAETLVAEVEMQLRAVVGGATAAAPAVSAAPLPPLGNVPATPNAATQGAPVGDNASTNPTPQPLPPLGSAHGAAPAEPPATAVATTVAQALPLPPLDAATPPAPTPAAPVTAPATLGAPPATTATAPASGGEAPTFVSILGKISKSVAEKKLTPDMVNACLVQMGLPANSLPALNSATPEQLAQFDALITAAVS